MSHAVSILCRPTPDGFAVRRRRRAATLTPPDTWSPSATPTWPAWHPDTTTPSGWSRVLRRSCSRANPAKSILPSFELPVIERYFPGYEATSADSLER